MSGSFLITLAKRGIVRGRQIGEFLATVFLTTSPEIAGVQEEIAKTNGDDAGKYKAVSKSHVRELFPLHLMALLS
jgi:hypothetical protein